MRATARAVRPLGVRRPFDELVAEAEAAPIEGWDFGWLDGRATEERPTWRYAQQVAQWAGRASAMLDVQTGGGELLAGLARLPALTVATEGYRPNVGVAGRRLRPQGVLLVVADDDRPSLPFSSGVFDLVTSRHPIVTWWDEIARVLRPGGSFVSQQVGPRSMARLGELLTGPQPPGSVRDPEVARAAAVAAGLRVEDLRSERLRTVFYDIGAVVYFLRLVVWIVPGFTVDAYREPLRALHDVIERDGSFVAHASRFFIRAVKPEA